MYFLLGRTAGSAHSGQEHGTLSGKEPEPLSSSPSTPASTPVEKAESGFVPGAGLPAIPATLVSRITRGEFIDLGELLPEYIGEMFLKSQQSSKHAKKPPPIEKPTEWMLVFSCFVAVMVHYKPSLTSSLVAYQASIMRLVRDYPGRAWWIYDRSFHQKMAASPEGDWGKLDHDLWALAIGARSTQEYKANTPPRRPAQACDNWNLRRCDKMYCPFPHVCSFCGRSGHKAPYCGRARQEEGQLPSPFMGPSGHPPGPIRSPFIRYGRRM